MKKLVFKFLLVAVILYCSSSILGSLSEYARNKQHAATPRQAATHLVKFDGAFRKGSCTGTAIGPHAFITAQHCNDDDTVTEVHFDYSLKTFKLLGHESDTNDHVIYYTDATFKNVVPWSAVPMHPGPVLIYGCGGWAYPCVPKRGRVLNVFDPSDLDAADGMYYFCAPIIPGDSGSVLTDTNGNMVGITTYSFSDNRCAAGFGLAFTPEQIHNAQTFPGKEIAKKAEPTPAKLAPIRNPFDIFIGGDN